MKSLSEFFTEYRRALLGMLIVLIIGIFLGLGIGHRGIGRDFGRGDFGRGGCGLEQQYQGQKFPGGGMMRGQNQFPQTGAVAQPTQNQAPVDQQTK